MNFNEAWAPVKDYEKTARTWHLKQLFDEDADRLNKFSVTAEGVYLDFSKNLIDDTAFNLLLKAADELGVEKLRDSMFAGEHINTSEDRPVLHVALRNPAKSHITANGDDVMPAVEKVRRKMKEFSRAVESGQWSGVTGKRLKTIVVVGIGGSQLGTQMLYEGLRYYSHREIELKFLSNIDGSNLAEITKFSNPEETLFIVVSKSFSTDETMTNARSAKDWIVAELGQKAIDQHFVAVTTNTQEAEAFGISSNLIFEFWDWVGGRFSVSSAIGLPAMIALGTETFQQFLDGLHSIDEHFRNAEPSKNIPIILGLISTWNLNGLDAQAEAVVPYNSYLHKFPAYLQQVVMESNGKTVDKNGKLMDYQTGQIVFGEPGTNAQHSFFQLIHQGTRLIPVDFIGFKQSNNPDKEHHNKLMANMIAQSEALAFGKTEDNPHKNLPGNRPSNTLLFDQLTPYSLGQLVAIYEHKVLVQGALWGINSFDQFGVQHGKTLAKQIESELMGGESSAHDASTNALIEKVKDIEN